MYTKIHIRCNVLLSGKLWYPVTFQSQRCWILQHSLWLVNQLLKAVKWNLSPPPFPTTHTHTHTHTHTNSFTKSYHWSLFSNQIISCATRHSLSWKLMLLSQLCIGVISGSAVLHFWLKFHWTSRGGKLFFYTCYTHVVLFNLIILTTICHACFPPSLH
jgi:hypothetical protein